MRNPSLALAATAVLTCVVSVTHGAPYAFTNIADSAGPTAFLYDSQAMASNGAVVFRSQLDTFEFGIFYWNGGAVQTVATGASGAIGLPAINPNGTAVTFQRNTASDPSRIFRWNGTSAIQVGYSDSQSAINNAGTMTFTLNLFDNNQDHVTLMLGNGTAIRNVADLSTAGINSAEELSISAAGNVVVNGFTSGGSPRTVFVNGTSGQVTLLSQDESHFGRGDARINDAGTISFSSIGNDGVRSFYARSEDTGGETLLKSSRAGFTVAQLDVNAAGQIAYLVDAPAAAFGIYSGIEETRVIGRGDSLFNSTVLGVDYIDGSLNDAGQIVFTYVLADGRKGIARADIPEPAVLSLVAVCAGTALLRRHRTT